MANTGGKAAGNAGPIAMGTGATGSGDSRALQRVQAASKCPVCGCGTGTVLSRVARDGGGLTTVLCDACGVARTDPMPSEAELDAYYASEYRLDYKGVLTPKKKHVLRAGWLARERLSVLLPRLQPGAAVLDLGAGGGEFVAMAGSAGLQAEGIEPNQGYANHAAQVLGLRVRQGRWQDFAMPEPRLAAVTMFHVLEHLPDPLGCVRQIAGWLQPGGCLFVEVPNLVAPLATRKRRFHRAHLVHFTPETLASLVRRAGFEVLEARAPGDGGNAVVLARKPTEAHSNGARSDHARFAGQASEVEAVGEILRFEQSSPWSFRLWKAHLQRLLGRLGQMVKEQRVISRFRDGRSLLEALQQGRI